MAYTPTEESGGFNYDTNEMGIRVYKDKHVQVTYINLRALSKLISSLRTQSEIDLQDAINNVGASAVKDQTYRTLGIFGSKIFEGISAFFKGGTPQGIIATLIGKISSAVINLLIEESKPGDEIQSKANEIREGMLAIFDATKKKIDQMIVDLENHWDEAFYCEDYSNLGIKGYITLSQMAECLDFFPDEETPDYDDFQFYLFQRCKATIVKELLPVKWKAVKFVHWWVKDYYLKDSVRHFDFDYFHENDGKKQWVQFFSNPDGPEGEWFTTLDNSQTGGPLTSAHFLDLVKRWLIEYHHSFWAYSEYVDNVLEDDKYYYGAHVYGLTLTDKDTKEAPTTLSDWLFQDDVYGNQIKKYAVATRKEVYTEWGL